MLPIQRFVDIPTGAVITGGSQQTLGTFDENNPREQFKLRQLRVGLDAPKNGVRYTALLIVPGRPDPIGPIDIPFRLNVEGPVTLQFTSDKANTVPQKITCTFHDLPDPPNLYGATYFVADASDRGGLAPAGLTPIPPWVVAVTIYSGGTATFYDNAGNNIGTATGPLLVARPRAAEFISVAAESHPSVLFHY